MSEFELLTYSEIADRLNIKLASVRQTVSRRGWQRVKSNDGIVRIHVPISYLQSAKKRADSSIETDVTINNSVDVRDIEIATLKTELTATQARLGEIVSDRDAWRQIAQKSVWQRLFGR